MELAQLIEALSTPDGYVCPVKEVVVRQTHISVVFLVNSWAYKIKKPVNLGFLDFSTLDKRRHFCDEEIRLNSRLAPGVYLGVVPVAQTSGGLKLEGAGKVVEWAVKMKRLPEEATFQNHLDRERLKESHVRMLARRIAAFHGLHPSHPPPVGGGPGGGDQTVRGGSFEVVAGNVRGNFEQVSALIGSTVSQNVLDRLRTCTEAALSRLGGLIEERYQRGVPRDTHGDLRLEHIYYFPESPPPGDLLIIDCIEFNDLFRYLDPVADMAFVFMDLAFHGRRDLAWAFQDAYFQTTHDKEGRTLLPFYTAYRAAVRGKVYGLELLEKEIPSAERMLALGRARAHWLMALGELDTPGHKPCLVLIGGLPGTGKSTLGQALAKKANLVLIRSDEVRKELAGLTPPLPLSTSGERVGKGGRAPFEQGLYTPAWTARTYAECRGRAEKLLFEGKRVVVDASFGAETRRLELLELARELAVPAVFLHCEAEEAAVRERLQKRSGDASDADWLVHQQSAKRWEEFGPAVRRVLRVVRATGTPEQVLSLALDHLREWSMVD